MAEAAKVVDARRAMVARKGREAYIAKVEAEGLGREIGLGDIVVSVA